MPLRSTEVGVVKRLVFERAAIVLSDDQAYLIESRLTPLAKEAGCDLSTLVARICREPHGGLHDRVVEAMTTNETSFFRDRHPFIALKDQLLPELLLARAQQRRLSVWSGACSSGQEAYSVLMLLMEAFPLVKLWDVKMLGTDLSPKMVERARLGVYSHIETGRGLPAALLAKYFEPDGTSWRVRGELRKKTMWKVLNLTLGDTAQGKFDLIFLRNVLIYFNQETRARVLKSIVRAMYPDSYLLLGSTETAYGCSDELEAITIGRTTAYRLKRSK
jgi:chemotaxis protein methyltransferase CheR